MSRVKKSMKNRRKIKNLYQSAFFTSSCLSINVIAYIDNLYLPIANSGKIIITLS
ncbi:hypothetical protein [Desulfomarina profundi]|uniref:hypothetical protein n=1 Tax=Desulfomarina profundi TaxID=2772557 RepID=UPI001E4743FD|nr:hypothetical protein [Desulfomarina profundi]